MINGDVLAQRLIIYYLLMNYEQFKPNTDNQEYTLNMSIESTQSIFLFMLQLYTIAALAQRITKEWEFWGKHQVSVK